MTTIKNLQNGNNRTQLKAFGVLMVAAIVVVIVLQVIGFIHISGR